VEKQLRVLERDSVSQQLSSLTLIIRCGNDPRRESVGIEKLRSTRIRNERERIKSVKTNDYDNGWWNGGRTESPFGRR
jgi:hypothetical protein